jgi:uncharacterized protein (TIGR03085 family)
MPWHTIEREQLAEALSAVAPDAPTLCEGWEARHLAAHVVLRERDPLVGLALVVPALSGRAESAIARLADESAAPPAYQDLVDRVAAGPSALHPTAWAPELVNLLELFVHTEDVRRGSGTTTPRSLDPDHVGALWAALERHGGRRLRRVHAGVILVRPDGVRHVLHTARGERGSVVVHGEVGELALYLFGRGQSAEIELLGDDDDLAELAEVLPA